MSRYYRPLFTILCYMAGDLLGMLAVGHPTGFGVWTFVASAVLFLIVFTFAKRTHGSQP